MSKLRNYVASWEPQPAPLPSTVLDGDFIRIDRIVEDGVFDLHNVDWYVLVKFDDEQTVKLRAGESIKRRQYKRLTFDLVKPTSALLTEPAFPAKIEFTAGTGELINRPADPTPDTFVSRRETMLAGVSGSIVVAGNYGTVETRLNIPLGQPNGVWLGSKQDDDLGTPYGFWLDVGVVDYVTFCGDIYYDNTGGADVEISITRIFRKD